MHAAELLSPQARALAEDVFLDARTLIVRFREPLQAPEQRENRNRFQKRGKGWILSYDGKECAYPDNTGFAYIHELLAHPNKEYSPEDLLRTQSILRLDSNVAADALELGLGETGDLGYALDEQAVHTVKRHMTNLQDRALETRELEDWQRLQAIQDELDQCADYLRKAQRKDGRIRRAASPFAANRTKVWHAVDRACKLIAEEDPQLARFLKRSIDVKSTCRYAPAKPTQWLL